VSAYLQIARGILGMPSMHRLLGFCAFVFYLIAGLYPILIGGADQIWYVGVNLACGHMLSGFVFGFHLRGLREGQLPVVVPGYRREHARALIAVLTLICGVPFIYALTSGPAGMLVTLIGPTALGLVSAYFFGYKILVVPLLTAIMLQLVPREQPFVRAFLADPLTATALNLAGIAGLAAVIRAFTRNGSGERAILLTSDAIASQSGGWRVGQVTPLARRLIEPILTRAFRNRPVDAVAHLELALASPGHRVHTTTAFYLGVVGLVMLVHWPMGVVETLLEKGMMGFYALTAYLTLSFSLMIDMANHRKRLPQLWLVVPADDRADFVDKLFRTTARIVARQVIVVTVMLLPFQLFTPVFTVQTTPFIIVTGLLFTALFTILGLQTKPKRKGPPAALLVLSLIVVISVFMFFGIVGLRHIDKGLSWRPILLAWSAAALLIWLLYNRAKRDWLTRDLRFDDGLSCKP